MPSNPFAAFKAKAVKPAKKAAIKAAKPAIKAAKPTAKVAVKAVKNAPKVRKPFVPVVITLAGENTCASCFFSGLVRVSLFVLIVYMGEGTQGGKTCCW